MRRITVLAASCIVLPYFIVASLIMLGGCSNRQQAADVSEIQRMGQKFKDKIESSFDKSDLSWVNNIALISALFAQETSFIPGVEWKGRYVPKSKNYTSGDGTFALVDTAVVYDRIRTKILNPDVTVGDVSPQLYLEYIEQVLSPEDIAKLKDIRERTKCFDKFKTKLEQSSKEAEPK